MTGSRPTFLLISRHLVPAEPEVTGPTSASVADSPTFASTMGLRVISGSANRRLAAAISELLAVGPSSCPVERFPDGELRPTVSSVRGQDVYVLQPTGPPVHDHLIELLLLLDGCQRAGAERITAVIPYLGYARQDRRNAGGQPVGAHVIARIIAEGGADRVVVVDPHTATVEAFFDPPVERLTAVPLLAESLRGEVRKGTMIVAPDLGAVKLAENYGTLLDANVAIVRKTRHSGSEVRALEVIGSVADRPVVIVDDMITTGATINAAARAVLDLGAQPDIVVAATHKVLGVQIDELAALPIRRMFVTDSLPHSSRESTRFEVVSIAPLLADAIRRLHVHQQLDDLLAPT